MALDNIQKHLLEEVADLHETPVGAYNIRANGALASRNVTENVLIKEKEGAPGIEIIIKSGTKNEKVHIPVIISESGIKETVYNDFIIGRLQNKFNRIELIADEITINEISDHLAIVIFKYHTDCNLRENNAAFGIAGLETQVMIKENDTWHILHVHYSK